MPAPAQYTIDVRSRQAAAVAAILETKGYEVFLPSYLPRRRWPESAKERRLPLFPGYGFRRFAAVDRTVPAVSRRGVLRTAGSGAKPCPAGAAGTKAVQAVGTSGLPHTRWQYVAPRSTVRAGRGPLAGIEGTLAAVNKREQLTIPVTLLQRPAAVEIEPEWVAAGAGTRRTAGRVGLAALAGGQLGVQR
jgi:hypothetical protein